MAIQPDEIFVQNVDRLAETAKGIADGARSGAGRPWQTPPKDLWNGDHADPAELTPAFSRDDLASDYQKGVTDPANPLSVGASVAIGAQMAWLGTLERAYRSRHCLPVRLLAHASARRNGHGHDLGVLKAGVVGHVQSALSAAGSTTES